MPRNTQDFSEGVRYWNDASRPESGYLARWTDEGNRERASRKMLGQSVESLEKKLKKAEDTDITVKTGLSAAPTEMSGDAASRKKAGKKAQTNWNLRRD